MNSFITGTLALLTAKFLVILSSFTMATVSVSLDAKKHNWVSAILAVFCGTVTGVIAASSIVALMGWPESTGYGVASIFAIAGERLVKSIMRAADNPLGAWSRWRKGE